MGQYSFEHSSIKKIKILPAKILNGSFAFGSKSTDVNIFSDKQTFWKESFTIDGGAFHECWSLEAVNYYGSTPPIDSSGLEKYQIFSISLSPTKNGSKGQDINVHVLNTYPRDNPFADIPKENINYDLYTDHPPLPTPKAISCIPTQALVPTQSNEPYSTSSHIKNPSGIKTKTRETHKPAPTQNKLPSRMTSAPTQPSQIATSIIEGDLSAGKSKDRKTKGMTVGIVFAVITIIVFAIVLIMFFRKQKVKGEDTEENNSSIDS